MFSVLACLALLLSFFGGTSVAQEKKIDTEKLYNEIAGSYEFAYEGQSMVFVVILEDGNLKVAPEGEVPDTMQPVEGKEMTFIAYSPTGDEYEFKFARDDEGKITTCTVNIPAMGIVVEGVRIKG